MSMEMEGPMEMEAEKTERPPRLNLCDNQVIENVNPDDMVEVTMTAKCVSKSVSKDYKDQTFEATKISVKKIEKKSTTPENYMKKIAGKYGADESTED